MKERHSPESFFPVTNRRGTYVGDPGLTGYVVRRMDFAWYGNED
jgi:hypothetical protein